MNKYERIAREVKERIMNKTYSSDQPIPDEISLASEFQVSRMTMKKALDTLVSEGLLIRKRGHGTFIVKSAYNSPVNVVVNEMLGLTNLLRGKEIKNKIIAFDVQFPTEEAASHLFIDPKSPVYHMIRLRIVEGEPYVMEKTYMPVNLISGLTEEVLYGSIYKHIKEELGLNIVGSHRTIRASKATKMDQEHLICAADDPILEIEQVGFLDTGIPFEYSFSRHRYDKFVFTTVNRMR
ncbi:GntR family transcriptional regulator [Paenibacillus medicaginis]|uniref:GntR family transcriptional regulator n=1 Tax=Paenibacillus medicaginis TaxID=1470560 RepID=A0ABV5C801_9BACL